MAIELNNRTKILAGVAVLAFAGAGVWFFFLEEFLNPPPPPPAAKAAPKPAAGKTKGAPAAPVPADAPKQSADAAKPAAAASAAPKGPAKPVPTEPAKVVAEVLETSGTKPLIQGWARDLGSRAGLVSDQQKELAAFTEKLMEPFGLLAELSASLTKSYDANRMPRYLQVLREPVVQKVVAAMAGLAALPAKESAELIDQFAKNPPAAARAKLIARLEEVNRAVMLDMDVDATFERAQIEGNLEHLQENKDKKAAAWLEKLGEGNPRNARPAMLARVDGKRGERIRQSVSWFGAAVRDVSDAELAEYLKLIDTEIGEWGVAAIAGALNPAMTKRGREHGFVMAKMMFTGTAVAKAPGKEKPAAQAATEKDKPAEVATAKAPAAPKEPPAYQRPASIREIYSRYNDVVSATVMRDRAALKELLDDGKNPNARQADGYTPLMIAASNDDTEIAAMLLAKGADPNPRAGGKSALSVAKSRGSAGAAMVQLLGRSGAKE